MVEDNKTVEPEIETEVEVTEEAEVPKPLTRKDWLNPNRMDGEYRADDKEEKGKLPVYRTLTSITPATSGGSSLMCSRGVAHVKRVTVDAATGEELVEVLRIPITTERLDVVMKNFSDQRHPVPPMKDKLVHQDSEIGKELGLTASKVCSVACVDDPKYRKAIEDFNTKQSWSVVSEAIDIPLEFNDSAGKKTVAQTTSDKVASLRQTGFTEAQVMQIANAIGRIQHWSKTERINFFGGS